MNQKKILILSIILLITGSELFSQTRPPLEVTRVIFPDLTVFGYSSYLTIQGALGLDNEFNELDKIALSTGILMMASSGLHMTNNIFVTDPKRYKTVLWITRAGYLTAFTSSIIYGLVNPELEGENRIAIGFNMSIPSLIGFGLTFLPYPGGNPKTK